VTLSKLIRERRSIHVFQNRPVPLDLIQDMLDTSVWVPNHKMTQPWRFVLVHGEGRATLANAVRAHARRMERDPDKQEQHARKLYDKFLGIPMYVAVIIKENPNALVREEDYASASCIIHNFSLLAWEQGIGLVWETYGLIYSPEFREALGVQPGEKIVGVMHIGYPEKIPATQQRIPAAELLTVIG